jgi:hypothetical protein
MRLALILVATLSSGCSHTCNTETFYKPSNERRTGVETSYYPPTSALFSIKEASFSVGICGDRYITAPSDARSICVTIELGPTDSLKFAQPSLTLRLAPGRSKPIALGDIGYEIFCNPSSNACTSSQDSPTSSPPRKIHSRTSADRYAFSSALEFRGAADTLHQGAWFGHRLVGKRRYLVRAQVGSFENAQEISVQFPEMLLNGEVFRPPELRYRATTEDLCRTVVVQ